MHQGVAQASALTSGYHLAFVVAAALVVGALVVALTVLKTPEPAQHASEELPCTAEAAYSEAA